MAGVESSSFYGCKMSKCSSYTRYKNLFGFFNERFENSHQNLIIFSEIPANLLNVKGNETLTREEKGLNRLNVTS